MIKISKLADYGTILMVSLSTKDRLSAAALSKKTHITLPTVSKVLKLLSAAGLVVSTQGVRGGYQLARAPSQISIAQVISAIDGEPAMTECSQEVNGCIHSHCCELRGNWQYINNLIDQVLGNISLVDMGYPLEDSRISPLKFYPTLLNKSKNRQKGTFRHYERSEAI